jgi:stearoyl-CoA desaturase (delta-9 desaturase)
MAFIDIVLQEPSYKWRDEKGELVVPTTKQIWQEAFSRMNIFKTKKNWIPFITCLMVACMVPFLVVFLTQYFSLWLVAAIVVYSMIIMGTHGTIWFHRYCTHKAYKFSHPIFRFITQNLVIKTFPEEIYVVSHHVHHSKSDEPGDPYNPKGGFMYCMLSDVNHQPIAKDLSEADYKKAAGFLRNTGVSINTYAQYQEWGSLRGQAIPWHCGSATGLSGIPLFISLAVMDWPVHCLQRLCFGSSWYVPSITPVMARVMKCMWMGWTLIVVICP